MRIFYGRLAPLFLAILLFSACTQEKDEGGNTLPQVKLETSLGDIVIELMPEKAPDTVANFLSYVEDGFYDGTIFHRVIEDFMIQGGGFTERLAKKTTKPPIQNEADNGLRNIRGTIAMARMGDPHSASAQFFINTGSNNSLNFQSEDDGRAWGYAVFGRVVDGMEVLSAIHTVKTKPKGPFLDLPIEHVVIRKISIVE